MHLAVAGDFKGAEKIAFPFANFIFRRRLCDGDVRRSFRKVIENKTPKKVVVVW